MCYLVDMGESVALAIALGALGVVLMVGAVTVILWLLDCYHNWRVARFMRNSETDTRTKQERKEKLRASFRIITGRGGKGH